MRYLFYFLPIIVCIACSDSSGPNTTPPGKLTFIPKGPDVAQTEQGIDAVPDQDGVYLEWFATADPNTRYIDIYRQREDETFYRRIWTIDLETASSDEKTAYVDDSEDVAKNSYNYYYLITRNGDGVEGQPSDTMQYNLLEKPELSRPNGDVVDGLPTFTWRFPDIIPENYILRIEEEFTNRVVFVREFKVTEYFSNQSLDLAKQDDPPQFVSGFTYRWRIDSVGAGILDPDDRSKNYSGSESQWLTFIAN
jgi:hypothetical protein